jgi:glucose-1-phosphate adenylyltransferase
MLESHKKNNADATISVIEVPIEEANRYGIMNTYEDGRIYEFEEKPEKPKSNLASMGVYIFTWNILREYLIRDSENRDSSFDFGKNIIPMMLNDNRSMRAYRFSGYWRDVGTIQAFWESNMDLIKRVPDFNLFDPLWRIYTPNPVKHAHYIGPKGSVKKSIIAEGCMIYGTVRNSVIFPGVLVEEGSIIEGSIVMSNSRILKNSTINHSILGERVTVGSNVRIGIGELIVNEFKPGIYNSGITVVGEEAIIPDGAEIGRNVMIDINSTIEDYCSLKVASGKNVFKGGVCE